MQGELDRRIQESEEVNEHLKRVSSAQLESLKLFGDLSND